MKNTSLEITRRDSDYPIDATVGSVQVQTVLEVRRRESDYPIVMSAHEQLMSKPELDIQRREAEQPIILQISNQLSSVHTNNSTTADDLISTDEHNKLTLGSDSKLYIKSNFTKMDW